MILIDDYPIDCILEETHDQENEATKYPVESGATITDHLQEQPKKVSLQGLVSDTPIGAMKSIRADRPAAGGLAGGILASDTGIGPESALALAKLRDVWKKKEFVTITTTLGEYKNMLPISLSIPRSKQHTGMLQFTATFEEQIIVENVRQAVGAPPSGLGDKSTNRAGLRAVRCVKRRADGSCELSEVLVQGADGKWRHPAGVGPDGKPLKQGKTLTQAEMKDWSKDASAPTFDKTKNTWVDSKGKPINTRPGQVMNADDGKVKKGAPDSLWDRVKKSSKGLKDRPQPQNPKPSGS